MAADHVADVLFGQVAVGEVDHRVAVFAEFLYQVFAAMTAGLDLDTDENGGIVRVRITVVEFGDAAFVQGVDEGLEGTGAFRDGDRQDRLALLTDLRAL